MKKFVLLFIFITTASLSNGQSQEGFLGEVKMFAGNFAPRGWAKCDGQLLAISSNPALFSILGTMYGGDGRTTFALPDFRGRTAVGTGTGPGLSPVTQGSRFGTQSNTLNILQLPVHNHTFSISAVSELGNTNDPTGNYHANSGLFDNEYRNSGTVVPMHSGTSSNAGASQPVENRQPSLGMIYIICTQGIFPSRT